MPGTIVELDDLSDHDLLIQIAQDTKCLPDMQKRLGIVEQRVAAQEVKGGIVAAICTAVATLLGIYIKP